MGHTRLGEIPKSKKWDAVVEAVLASADVGQLAWAVPSVAGQTADAAAEGIRRAASEPGLVYSFYLLAHLSLAGRRTPVEGVSILDFNPLGQDSIYDLLGQAQLSIDSYVGRHGGTTDYSEMAQRAAGEALLQSLEPFSASLFGSGQNELRSGLRAISTVSGFSQLSQTFFGDFLARFLNFYLSRITARANEYDGFRQVLGFNEDLRLYSYQSSAIVCDFAAAWVSKTAYADGVTIDNTRAFMAVAAKKLAAELKFARSAQHGRP